VPVIALENITDDEAWVYVIETNLMQRSFSDMAHSEKAAVIATQHRKLFSQGKRNDILKQLEMLENPHDNADNETYAQVAHKMKSREIVAKEYSLSKDTVARYLRIHQLVPALKTMLDGGAVAFIPAVTLSFLKEREQNEVARCIELNCFSCDMKKADVLRQYSQDSKLNEDNTFLILNGELGQKPPPNRTPVVKVNKAVYARYFKPNQSAKEIQDIVEKALAMYFEAQEE
jgi:ParB family chromosome partitioning protein